jgi:hypothetical protein
MVNRVYVWASWGAAVLRPYMISLVRIESRLGYG